MFKYGKYMLVALLVSGLLAVSYGGCGGGSSDGTSGGGNPIPTNTPTAPPTTDDDIVIPPTNPSDTGACEGDAFNSSASASAREVGDFLTDFFVRNSNDSSMTCFCNAPEAGNFIFKVAPVFAGFMKINLEFPENNDPNTIVPTSFSFDWTAPGCNTLELFTTQLFLSDDLISIGTLDNITEIAPDQLTFTSNLSDPLLSSALGNSGQNVSCDFCSIDALPQCAPEL
jgi:hypothetical protein